LADALGCDCAACSTSNELMTIRLRTKVHEVIVLPSENYIIIVVQNPGT